MKTLIVYTTKRGTAEKAAMMLKNALGGNTTLVNLARDKAPELSGFDTVILGGSIYVGSIQKKLSEFAAANAQILQGKKLGLFICAGMEKEWAVEMEKAFPQELRARAAAKDNFGYEFDFKKMNFLEKAAIGKIAGIKESVSKLSKEKIEAFARALLA